TLIIRLVKTVCIIVITIRRYDLATVLFKSAAIELSTTALSDHIDDAARRTSELRREVSRRETKFADRILRNGLRDRGRKCCHVLGPIKQDIGTCRTLTVNLRAYATARRAGI